MKSLAPVKEQEVLFRRAVPSLLRAKGLDRFAQTGES